MIGAAIKDYNEQNGFGRWAPKVVLFDMDGTLINSMPNHAVAWTRTFRSIGIVFSEEDAYLTEGARGIDTIRRYVFDQTQQTMTEERAKELYDEKARCFALLPTPQVMDGAFELMEKLQRSGLQIGIVTGSAQVPLIERILSDFGKYVSRDSLVTALDVAKGKPDPEPYLKGMEKFAAAPNETLIVENAPLGIESGRRSGAFVVAVNTGPLSDDLLLSAGAHVLYRSVKELADNWEELSASL